MHGSYSVKAVFITICAIAIGFLSIAPAHAATFCVDDTSDGAANAADCATTCDGSNDCSLRDAVESANGNPGADEIDLTNVSGTITLLSVLPNVTESVDFNGPGATNLAIDGNGGGYRFFYFDSPTNDQVFSISDLRLTNASGTSAGTAMYVYAGETLTIDSCMIDGNNGSSLANSGTISVGSITGLTSTLNVIDSTITGNTVGNMGGGLHNGCSTGTCLLNVIDSTISANRAGRWGGGIATSNAGATTTIVNSLISDNQSDYDNNDAADGHGGALNSNGATVIVKNSTITGNSANGAGGAVAAIYSGASITLMNTTVVDNRADRNDSASYFGGGLYDDTTGGSISVQNSIVAKNLVTTSDTEDNCDGSGIISNGNNLESQSDCGFNGTGDLQDTDPLIQDFYSDNGGPTQTFALLPGSPAIDAGNDSACSDTDIDGKDQRGLTRCVDADGDGSGNTIDIGAFELQVFTVDTLGNDADFDTSDGVCDTDDHVGDGPCTLKAAIVQANNSTFSPGPQAVNFSVNGTINATKRFEVVESLAISGPGASSLIVDMGEHDRVIQFSGSSDDRFTLSGLTITGGSINGAAGGIFVSDENVLTVRDCIINNNRANNPSAGNGGGIGVGNHGTLTVIDSILSNNIAYAAAGAIASGPSSKLSISGSTISGNVNGQGGGTNRAGGGIGCSSCELVNITNSTISGNSATGSGGGLFMLGGTASLSNATLFSNAADSDDGADGTGGGIGMLGGATVNVKNTIIAGNTDSDNGAADCSGTVVSGNYNIIQDLSGCTIDGTTANNITGQDPLLDILADNGGSTQTHAMLSGSPAIDAANPAGCTDENDVLLATDQRGFQRPANGRCDIGSYENGTCGDGVLDVGEECDNASANSDTAPNACRKTCLNPSCGDGVVDAGEGCDDGNQTDGDGCQANCALPSCGDGVQDAGEACDDGAANSDTVADACRTTCVEASCGDGVVDSGEACEDGNANDTDACLTTCTDASCGDGVVWAGVEECDDGNDDDTDACSLSCVLNSASDTDDGGDTADTGDAAEGSDENDGGGCALVAKGQPLSAGATLPYFLLIILFVFRGLMRSSRTSTR